MTAIYCRFFEELNSRLDENYNNPKYDEIENLMKKNKFQRTVSLGDAQVVLEKTSGKTPAGLKYLPEGVPFLGASNINDSQIDLQDCERIDFEMHDSKKLCSSKIRKGNLLITIAGSIGRCAVYVSDEEANCNQAVAVLRLNEQVINPYYAVEYLNSHIGKLFFGKLQHISSQPNINLTELGEITVVLPNVKKEQERILEILQPLKKELQDLKIAREKKMIEINNYVVKHLGIDFHEPKNYFFKKGQDATSSYFTYMADLDRFHYLFNDLKSKLLNRFSSKYLTIRFKNVCIEPIIRGEQPEYSLDGEITVIKTIDMKDRYIDFDNCLKVTRQFYDKNPSAQVKAGDILVASTGYGSLGKVDIYNRKEPAMVDGHIAIIRISEEYDPQFVVYFLRSTLGQIQFEKWFSGSSGQIEIQPTDLGNFLLPSAKGLPLKRQQEIAIAISNNYKEIEEFDKKINLINKKIENRFFEELF